MEKKYIQKVSAKTGITTSLLGLYLRRGKRPCSTTVDLLVSKGFDYRPFLFGKEWKRHLKNLRGK